jgi:hypothetical protein
LFQRQRTPKEHAVSTTNPARPKADRAAAPIPEPAREQAPASDGGAPVPSSGAAPTTVTADTFAGRAVALDGTGNGVLLTQTKTRAYTIGINGDQSSISMARSDRLYMIILNGEVGDLWARNNISSNRLAANIVDLDGPENHIKFAHSKTRYYTIGINGDRSAMDFANRDGFYTISLDGQNGDIRLSNADCAEDFDLADEAVEPGMVMTIDADGRLRAATEAYDPRLAGVISGAGGFKPAMVLDRQPQTTGRAPLALMGKVFCKVDATHASIDAGDLLTSSSTPGHAMAVRDVARAAGAVLGKALRPLRGGQGLIPVLVNPQ